VDQAVSVDLNSNRPFDQLLVNNLPPGLSLSSDSKQIVGIPSSVGSFISDIETSNQAGSLTKSVIFEVRDFGPWIYSTRIEFPGYTESSTIEGFPVYLELNTSIAGFSYEQFASEYGHDLRFLTEDGKSELPYEPIEWNPTGTSSYWVLLNSLDANTSIKAIWGNPNYGEQPGYCRDGSVWSKYRAVWHMDGDDESLVRDSSSSFHATPFNFNELRTEGVIGTAINFDGVNDYLELPVDSHPPAGSEHLTISFWTHGNFPTLTNSTLFESGSALGRHLNVHFPWSNSRFYWDAGMSNQYDRIEKEDSNYLGAWIYWTLQKDVELGIMRVYKNGELFLDGFNKTRPIGGPVESFRLGSGRTGGLYWNGWVDEFRMGLFIESAASIKASYLSQRPDSAASFANVESVEGPPVIAANQTAEGFSNDSSRPFYYQISVFPSADAFSAVGLPAGITLNASTGELEGVPLQGGNYQITVTASNQYGQSQEIVYLRVSEINGFTHSIQLGLSGYSGSQPLTNFPMLVRMNPTLDANFSLNSFASTEANDLRFFDDQGRSLPYEIESIDFEKEELVAWVRVAELANDRTIFAYWGNEDLSAKAPEFSTDGSTWNAAYRGVWHLSPVSISNTLTDSTIYRNHAQNIMGSTDINSMFGAGRYLVGGGEQYVKIPKSYSLNELGRQSYSFSMWAKLENQPDTEAFDSFYASGYERVPNDLYFNDINELIALQPSGTRIYKGGPRQGLYLSGDTDFRNANIGINRNDNYMTLFLSMFHPPEDGAYKFRCTDKDDRATIWLDLDGDGEFELNGE
jgi:hypothetical protein